MYHPFLEIINIGKAYGYKRRELRIRGKAVPKNEHEKWKINQIRKVSGEKPPYKQPVILYKDVI